jgi:hypothetical protein
MHSLESNSSGVQYIDVHSLDLKIGLSLGQSSDNKMLKEMDNRKKKI